MKTVNQQDRNCKTRREPKCSLYNSELIIEGYFIRFGKRSKLLREELFGTAYSFTETFTKGSLDKAIKRWENGEIHCAFKVDHNEVFGGKLRLRADQYGGYFTFKMEDTTGNRKLWNRVNTGELTETSFQFGITKNQYSLKPDNLFEGGQVYSRMVFDIEYLKDVSIVKNPAYEGNGINCSKACLSGKGLKTTRSVNNYNKNNFVSLSERAAEVQKLISKEQRLHKKQEDMSTINDKLFKKFTGIPMLNGEVSIEEELRMVDTANASLTTQMVDVLLHNNPTDFKAQLESCGLNFLHNGKVNRVNNYEFNVGTGDEHGEFPAFDDLNNIKPESFTKKRIGATFIVNNELLASSDYVNSIVRQANNEIFAAALGYLINEQVANFTELAYNPMTPEFITAAIDQVKSIKGTFLAKETDMAPQLFTAHGVKGNVINKVSKNQYRTVSGNLVMYGIDKYLTNPTISIYGDFRYAFMNVITKLEVIKNHFTYAKQGQSEVTFFREIGISITDTTKFCKSQLPT